MQAVTLTNSDMQVIATKTVDAYEERIGKPREQVNTERHEANLGHFDQIYAALNQLKGAVWAFGALGSFLTVCGVIVGIVDVAMRMKAR